MLLARPVIKYYTFEEANPIRAFWIWDQMTGGVSDHTDPQRFPLNVYIYFE